MSPNNSPQSTGRDWLIYMLVPLFMSCNLIFGRGLADEASPVITSLIRWLGSVLFLVPFMRKDWPVYLPSLCKHLRMLLALSFVFIVVCGAGVYWSLTHTTASNATLIYTTSPIFVILAERILWGRVIARRELTGILLAGFGVVAIVLRGDFGSIAELTFNVGDLGMLVASVAFAVYSLLLRNSSIKEIPPLVLLSLIALVGSALLAPLAVWEVIQGGLLPELFSTWLKLLGLILFASLAAYLGFQHTVRVFGPTMASTTLYLMTPASILMAVLLLGESFELYHAVGFVLVLGGVMLATFRLNSSK